MSTEQNAEQEPNADDLMAQVIDLETQKRLWIRALTPVLQLRSQEGDPSERVQFAFDMMHVAAAEKIARLCQSELA